MMFRPADRLAGVQPSATKAMTAKARELRASGRDIITLSQGEPDFDTPDHIVDAGIEALRQGHTRYTDVIGMLPLRQAIAEKLYRDNGLKFSTDEIVVGCGAKQVLFNALYASVNPSDEVIIPAPCWVSYPELVRLVGGYPVVVQCPAESSFKLTPEALEQAITPRVRWLMLNSPSNPTGAVYRREELMALGEVLRQAPHVWILCDDIYEKLIYDDVPFTTLAEVCPDLRDRILVVNGVSKSAAMTGWRVGYGAGNHDLIKAMAKIQGQTTSHTSSISQYAAIRALRGDQSYISAFRAAFEHRRDLLLEALSSLPGMPGPKPQGAFYLFVPVHHYQNMTAPSGQPLKSDVDLAMYLLETAGVAVVPGTGFLAPGYLRLSYAESDETLRAAADCILKALSKLG